MARKTAPKPEDLEELLKNHKGEKWAGLTHKYPDPDAIASLLGMQKILKHYGINLDLFYSGEVSRRSNKIMVNRLEIYLSDQKELNPDKYNQFVIVDATEQTVEVPNKIVPLITIDHHDVDIKELKGEFIDITEKGRGSTSTRIVQYLNKLNIPLEKGKDAKLATALFYGIYTDTRKLTKANKEDDEAIAFLRDYCDSDLIEKITTQKQPTHVLRAKANAINNMYIQGIYLLAFAGTLIEKEDLSEVADELVQTEGIELAIVYGILEKQIIISIRNNGDQIHCGQFAKKLWEKYGSAGGREKAAAASITMGYVLEGLDSKSQEMLVQERVKTDVFEALKIEEKVPTEMIKE